MVLDSRSTQALEELVHVNIDSHRGFKVLSMQIEDADCRSLFRELAWKRRQDADLLLRHMHSRERDIARHGALKRALHQWWLHLRTSLEASSTRELIAEAEQGEEAVEKCYERVFSSLSDGVFRDVLGALHREARRDHHRIHRLGERMVRSR
jgi:uncharacterized protein (TIGR02284 family)